MSYNPTCTHRSQSRIQSKCRARCPRSASRYVKHVSLLRCSERNPSRPTSSQTRRPLRPSSPNCPTSVTCHHLPRLLPSHGSLSRPSTVLGRAMVCFSHHHHMYHRATPKCSPPPSSPPTKRRDAVKKGLPATAQPLQGVWAHKAAAVVQLPARKGDASPNKAAADAKATKAAAAKPPPPPPRATIPHVVEPKMATVGSPPGAVPKPPPRGAAVAAEHGAAASPPAPVPAATPLQIRSMRNDSLDAPCSPTSGGKPPPPPPRAAVTMPANQIAAASAAPLAAAPTSPNAARKLVDSWETWPPGAHTPPATKPGVERPLPQSSLSASLCDNALAVPDGEMVQAALQAIALRKTLHMASKLRQVGFPDWACMAAVARHGTNLEASLEFLMSLGHEEHCTPEAAAAGKLLKRIQFPCPCLLGGYFACQWRHR